MKNRKYYWALGAGVVVVLVAVFTVSSSAAPQSSLYGVRLNVVEKTKELFIRDEFAKAKYQLELGNIRLQELQALKNGKMLDSKGGIMARDNFNVQTIKVQEIALNLAKKEGNNSMKVLELSESLDVEIEEAKKIYGIDQLEVLPE